MVVGTECFRNRREARFHSNKGRVSYPPSKAREANVAQTVEQRASADRGTAIQPADRPISGQTALAFVGTVSEIRQLPDTHPQRNSHP